MHMVQMSPVTALCSGLCVSDRELHLVIWLMNSSSFGIYLNRADPQLIVVKSTRESEHLGCLKVSWIKMRTAQLRVSVLFSGTSAVCFAWQGM